MENYKWNLEKIYSNDQDIEKDKKRIEELSEKYQEIKSTKKIIPIFEIMEECSTICIRLYAYSHMKRDEDSTISKSQKLALDADMILSKVGETFSSVEPIILSIPDEDIQKEREQMSDDYKRTLEIMLRKKPHILSENEEKILAITEDIANDTENAYYMLSNTDMTFDIIESDKEKKELTHANYNSFQTNKNRDIRKESFEKMHQKHKEYINTIGATYYGHVKAKEKIAKTRNYKNNLSQELFTDNVDLSLYTNLIDIMHDNVHYLNDFIEIKKNKLGLDDLTNYDLYVDCYEREPKKYPYEEGVRLIKEALKPLGDEYSEILNTAFTDRWIDVYPQKGKKGGAYSFGSYDTYPYVLMNYTDDLDSVSTLAHELGHSMHSYYSRKNNPYFTSDYTIFVAEVASTTNELLLSHYLYENAETEIEKKKLIFDYLERFRTTVFRQTMFAEFEMLVHNEVLEERSLTGESLSEIYYKLNKKYYPTLNVHELIKYEWARIPHFYSDFYVYKYATGLMSAMVLSEKIINNTGTDKYLEFLKDGSNHFPLEQLKNAGVDIKSKETMQRALDIFKEKVNLLK